MKNPSRDRALDRMLGPALRRSLQDGTDGCPDAETLAAWSEDGLMPSLREQVDAHLAACGRCQDHVAALVRSVTPAPSHAPQRKWLSWRWLVPAAAGATAFAIWVAVQPRSPITAPEPPPSSLAAARDIELPEAQPAQPVQRFEALKGMSDQSRAGPPSKSAAALAAKPAAPSRAQAGSPSTPSAPAESQLAAQEQDLRRENKPQAEDLAAPAARPAGKSRFAAADAVASLEILSTDISVRWRIRGTNVEHTRDGGVTWTTQATGTRVLLTAGTSPSPDVCWLVGRGGTVLRSVDGRSWQAIPFPENADLVEVQSSGPAHATVKTADSRRFTTTDGGGTWKRMDLQEF